MVLRTNQYPKKKKIKNYHTSPSVISPRLPLLQRRNLRLKLVHSLGKILIRLLRNAQDGLHSGQALAANGSLQAGTSLALASLELLLEHHLSRRREEDHGGNGPCESVKVYVGPRAEGVAKAKDEEGQRREGKGKLGGKIGNKVVVLLLRSRTAGDGIEEEGADEAAEVCILH